MMLHFHIEYIVMKMITIIICIYMYFVLAFDKNKIDTTTFMHPIKAIIIGILCRQWLRLHVPNCECISCIIVDVTNKVIHIVIGGTEAGRYEGRFSSRREPGNKA